jgi:hypothetical protein
MITMIATIALLLQLTVSLLTGAQHNDQMPLAVKQRIVAVAGQTIQLSTQALAKIDFPVPRNASIWPNYSELNNAPYLDAAGNYVRLGQDVQLVGSSISFGDINNDGLDDAMVVVKKNEPNGSTGYFLAAMLNQGGILFNIADAPLGGAVQIYSHRIQNGELAMDATIGNQSRSTIRYALLGNQLIKD